MRTLAVADAPRDTDRPSDETSPAERPLAGYIVTALRLGAAVVTAIVAYTRYHSVIAHADPIDLSIFLRAARFVAAGRSPYLVASPSKGYVYTPLLAIALAPFSHLSLDVVFRLWTVASLGAVALAGACITATTTARLRDWRPPVFFAVAVNTAYFLAPVTRDLELGQADLFIVALLCVAAWLRHHRHAGSGSGVVGLAGALKLWPVLAVVGSLGHGARHRLRAAAPAVAVVVAGLASSVAFGRLSGAGQMIGRVLGAGSQRSFSYSVWGIPRLWYSATGTAQALASSPELQIVTTVLLAGLVGWLLWVSLKRTTTSELVTWNVLGCAILLLPASHEYYAVYLVPIVWLWAARAFRAGRENPTALLVAGLLAVWWVVNLKLWPTDGTATPWTSSLPVSIPFLANVAACTASVVGEWRLQAHRPPSPVTDDLSAVSPTAV